MNSLINVLDKSSPMLFKIGSLKLIQESILFTFFACTERVYTRKLTLRILVGGDTSIFIVDAPNPNPSLK